MKKTLPAITGTQIILVQNSFALLTPETTKVLLDTFYAKLFELNPPFEKLFPHLEKQKEKLGATITAAINNLQDLTPVIPELNRLGELHAPFTTPKDYDTVGEALIYALGVLLGDAFTTELKEAWIVVYTILTTVMQDWNEKE